MSRSLTVEGIVEVGPMKDYFVLVDGEFLGKKVSDHFGLPKVKDYCELGRARITVELLQEAPTDRR